MIELSHSEVGGSGQSGALCCPLCNSPATTELIEETLDYATPNGLVAIRVNVPYISCAACGFSGFGEAGERARTEAIYRYHERLTPWDIVAIRNKLNLSQAEFSKRLGVGHASLERWEAGEKMQNVSMDNLILLMSVDANKAWLDNERHRRKRAAVIQRSIVSLDKFRALSASREDELRAEARMFRLRR